MNHSFRKILTVALLLFGTSSVFAQLGLELRPGHNDDRCPGFDDDVNTVIIDVVNQPPLTPSPNTRIEYYWLITHAAGEWVYQTDNDARGFKITLEGEYSMRCQVLYVDLDTTFPYASFWSAPLIFQTGENCE